MSIWIKAGKVIKSAANKIFDSASCCCEGGCPCPEPFSVVITVSWTDPGLLEQPFLGKTFTNGQSHYFCGYSESYNRTELTPDCCPGNGDPALCGPGFTCSTPDQFYGGGNVTQQRSIKISETDGYLLLFDTYYYGDRLFSIDCCLAGGCARPGRKQRFLFQGLGGALGRRFYTLAPSPNYGFPQFPGGPPVNPQCDTSAAGFTRGPAGGYTINSTTQSAGIVSTAGLGWVNSTCCSTVKCPNYELPPGQCRFYGCVQLASGFNVCWDLDVCTETP